MTPPEPVASARSDLEVNTPLLLLGGLAHALSITRSLGRRGVPIIYLGNRSSATTFSRHLAEFVEVDELAPDSFMEGLRRPATPRGVVLPLGDRGNECVAHHRDEMEDLGYVVIEANDSAMLDMLDKQRTYEIARKADVKAPKTVVLTDPSGVAAALEETGLPAALKPRISHQYAAHFAGKAVVVESVEQAEQAARAITDAGVELLMTEVVQGPEGTYWGYYVYVDQDGAPLFQFTKRKLRQYPLGFGLGTLHRMENNNDVIDAGWRFAQMADVRGLVNIEFKHDSRSGEYVLIESNHRITAANELIRRAGIDLAEFIYRRLTDQPTAPMPEPRTDLVLWWPIRDTVAAVGQMGAGELSLGQWLGQLRGRIILPAFSLTDPVPALGATARSLRNADRHIRRVLGRSHR